MCPGCLKPHTPGCLLRTERLHPQSICRLSDSDTPGLIFQLNSMGSLTWIHWGNTYKHMAMNCKGQARKAWCGYTDKKEVERHPYLRNVLGQLLRAPSWEGRHIDSCEEQKGLKALFYRWEDKSCTVCFADADTLKPHRRPLILSELL